MTQYQILSTEPRLGSTHGDLIDKSFNSLEIALLWRNANMAFYASSNQTFAVRSSLTESLTRKKKTEP